jgi:hypothetical protein
MCPTSSPAIHLQQASVLGKHAYLQHPVFDTQLGRRLLTFIPAGVLLVVTNAVSQV